ncbi:MAG: AAA family ATPase [Symploca sp. SIO2D2]|nr:AAA family ATPase [Symploca sp. SIO2D2]
MLPFREEHKDLFFGREEFVQQLVKTVKQHPLVPVIGASGSGKSSVVFAGLIPKLRAEGTWLIESFRPNKQPFYELAAALISQLEPELSKTDKTTKAIELAKLICQHGFTAYLSAILKDKPEKRLLLVVDQFEELYTGCATTKQQQFIDALLKVVESASGTVTLVLTLRADFYSYVVNYPPFTKAFNKYPAKNITLMTEEEIQEAIERPAQKMGVQFEDGLTQQILDDVKQEQRNLPLLEFALTQLWKQSQGQLTHKAYSEIGRVKKALVNYAEEVYEQLTKEQQQQAAKILVKLVRRGVGIEYTRRVLTRSQVGNWELVTQLATKRLLVTGRNEAMGEETVEVIHEALIREWEKLRLWVDKNRDVQSLVQSVEDAQQVWQAQGKKTKYLLEGRLLKKAKRLLKELSDVVTGDVRSFVRQSLLWRRAQFAGVLIIPLLLLGVPAEFFLREESVKQDYARIERSSTSKQEEKIAVVNLVRGCWTNDKFRQILPYFRERIFGNCRTLQGVNLENADLQGTNLSRANLSQANLSGSNLDNVIGNGVNLNNADLSKATFNGANLNGANLMGVNAPDAIFNDANLSDINFGVAKLMNASLSRANLNGANLGDADLSNAMLGHAKLINSNLFKSNLRGASLGRANLSGARLFHTNLQDASLGGSNLQRASLNNANLSNSSILNADLSDTDLSGSDLTNVIFNCGIKVIENRKKEVICPNMKNVKWDKQTKLTGIKNWQSIQNIPLELKRLLQGMQNPKSVPSSPSKIITVSKKNTLLVGEKLVASRGKEDRITSPNRCFNLVLQEDGNLVLYNNKIRKSIWASNTDGKPVRYALFSKEGYLALYGYGDGEIVWQRPSLNEDTNNEESRLVIQDDGNVVIYKSRLNNQVIWATNTSDTSYYQTEGCYSETIAH